MNIWTEIALVITLTVVSYAQDREFKAEDRKVKVMGTSGKITYGEENLKEPVTIEFHSLSELDANGSAVGTAENVTHDFSAFTSQIFTTTSVMDNKKIYNVSAMMMSYSTQLSNLNSTMKVYVYIMKQDANVTVEGEDIMLMKGMLKFSIELEGWNWCGCNANGSMSQTETGEFVDVAIAIKGKGNANKLNMTNTMIFDNYDLGSGQMLYLSKKVQVDGAWQNMTTGFPKMEMQGMKQVFTFRIPKFNQTALYDPLVTVPTSTKPGPTSSGSVPMLSYLVLFVVFLLSI